MKQLHPIFLTKQGRKIIPQLQPFTILRLHEYFLSCRDTNPPPLSLWAGWKQASTRRNVGIVGDPTTLVKLANYSTVVLQDAEIDRSFDRWMYCIGCSTVLSMQILARQACLGTHQRLTSNSTKDTTIWCFCPLTRDCGAIHITFLASIYIYIYIYILQ